MVVGNMRDGTTPIGIVLKWARDRAGVAVAAVAERASCAGAGAIDAQRVVDIERWTPEVRGVRPPTEAEAAAVSVALGLPITELILDAQRAGAAGETVLWADPANWSRFVRVSVQRPQDLANAVSSIFTSARLLVDADGELRGVPSTNGGKP